MDKSLFWCVECLVCWVVFGKHICYRWIRVRAVNLVQASRARLSESDEGSPKPFFVRGRPSDLLNFWASEHLAQARGVSPKRDPALFSWCFFEPSPRRMGLAWASMSRLSETLQPEQGAGRGSARWNCFLGFVWKMLAWF